MKITKVPLFFYPKAPIAIGDQKATYHQFDCLAVFYHTRSLQKTAILLGLTSKGVDSHLRNFRRDPQTGLNRLTDDIILFLDSTPKPIRNALKTHYRYILVERKFQETLRRLRKKSSYTMNAFEGLTKHIDHHLNLITLIRD